MVFSRLIIYSKNQIIIVAIIIFVCTVLSSLIFLLRNIHWFRLLIVLIYIRGVIVLFIFVVSIAPNEKTLLKEKNKKIVLVLIVLVSSFKLACTSENLKINSSIEQRITLIVIIAVIILFIAYLPPKVIRSFYKGMKSTK